jgi:hypothetical protein
MFLTLTGTASNDQRNVQYSVVYNRNQDVLKVRKNENFFGSDFEFLLFHR